MSNYIRTALTKVVENSWLLRQAFLIVWCYLDHVYIPGVCSPFRLRGMLVMMKTFTAFAVTAFWQVRIRPAQQASKILGSGACLLNQPKIKVVKALGSEISLRSAIIRKSLCPSAKAKSPSLTNSHTTFWLRSSNRWERNLCLFQCHATTSLCPTDPIWKQQWVFTTTIILELLVSISRSLFLIDIRTIVRTTCVPHTSKNKSYVLGHQVPLSDLFLFLCFYRNLSTCSIVRNKLDLTQM